MSLSPEIIKERMEIARLSHRASNILAELTERTGVDFTDTQRALGVIDEVSPRITHVTPRVETETEEVPF